MNRTPRPSLFLLLLAILLPLRAAASDPCDFASAGTIFFPYDQVMACYESVPFDRDDLENIVAVIAQHRSFSDLAEHYDANWAANLAAIAEQDFDNDFAMHNALIAEHKSFRNVHVLYMPPSCYRDMIGALIPLDFGATTRFLPPGEKQVVFVEAAPYGALYEQVTGTRILDLVGMRVVEINGTPVLDYFRTYGQERLQWDANDGVHFNFILNHGGFTGRELPWNFLPEGAAEQFVFESRDGKRFSRALPWVFLWQGFGGPAPPLTGSTEEFVEWCSVPHPAKSAGTTKEFRHARQGAPEPRRLPKLTAGLPEVTEKDFFEVPPALVGKFVEPVEGIPETDDAKVMQLRNNVTVIRLNAVVDWTDTVRLGIDHACRSSDRLILDLRGASGGIDVWIRWLYNHLFAEEDPVEAGKLPFRVRNDNPKLNEYHLKSAMFDELSVAAGFPPCTWTFGPQCLANLDTGEPLPLDLLDWWQDPSVLEERGGVELSLSRQVVAHGNLWHIAPDFDVSGCAGRFSGDNLIFLTDGLNKSASYFLPAAFKGKGVIVTAGGFVDEPLVMGTSRGGPQLEAALWAWVVKFMEDHGLPVGYEFLQFERNVESWMEHWGVYRKNRGTLHLHDPVEADLRLYVWSDSPGTEGYVYSRLLEVVDAAGERH